MNQITRSIVGASVLLNGILIATIVGAFPFFLFLSLVANLLMFLQARKLLEEVNTAKDDMEEISTSIHSFSEHIEKVHEMEAFYGDDVLQGLMQHSQSVVEDIDSYTSKQYEVSQETKETDFDDEETTETEDN